MRKLFVLIVSLWTGAIPVLAQTPLIPRDTTISNPQTFAIIVGISKYKYVRPLNYADRDAELFMNFLQSPGGGNVKKENIFCLLNEKANNHNFWSKGFQWLKAKDLRKGDQLFIYLAGHGDAIDADQFFFLGYDCNPGGDKNNYLVSGAIQLFNLKKKIADETAKGVDVFFIMDACRSDELPGGMPGQNFLNTAISEKKAGEIIMLATGAGQESLEDASIGNGHGLFTYFLIDGLNGMADSVADSKISFAEIQQYVMKNVPFIAQQRFNHTQEPYFCCNENSDKIISSIDTAYFRNWLKKRQPVKGPGNSFPEEITDARHVKADTSLIQAYNQFYKAVNAGNLNGTSSARYYYDLMENRFPGSPYTLDAKTTLAAEFIGYAQNKINQYLDCSNDLTAKGREENTATAALLEKAIELLKTDVPEFANSLLARLYFLKSGATQSSSASFQYAYACLAIDKNAAYICNRLASLHLQADNTDSAVFYARRAIDLAPNWRCAYSTLSQIYSRMNLPDSASEYEVRAKAPAPAKPISKKQRKILLAPGKKQMGIVAGTGSGKLDFSLSNWERGNVNYRDSLNGITGKKGTHFTIGVFGQLNFTDRVGWRPSLQLSFEEAQLLYDKKASGTLPPRIDTVSIKTSSFRLSFPVIFKLNSGNIAPYFSGGPSIYFLLQQDEPANRRLPLKSIDLLAEAGLGVDVTIPAAGIIISPEVKYSMGLQNMIVNVNNLYTNALSTIKRQLFTASLYIRTK